MSLWKRFPGRYLRWSNPACQALVLAAVTFGVVLPLACHRLLYSYYFLRSAHLDRLSDQVLEQSLRRGQDALRFWQNRTGTAGPVPIAQGAELLVTVVTARRPEGRDFHYLLQVMQALQVLLGACGGQRCAQVLVCDVESGPLPHEDASLLEGHFPVLRRPPQERGRVPAPNTFEREKRDYVWCLRAGWAAARPGNVLVLEDDALPRPDLFPVLRDVLRRRFARTTLYVKLYHPERLQRYWNPEPARLLEWAGLGVVGAALLLLLLAHWDPLALGLRPCPRHLLLLALYVMALGELVGRHYLLEGRRLCPQLYAVSPATECCTPAMLFPGNASLRAAHYLDASSCAKGHAKDLALYRLLRAGPEHAHSLEPNLVTHIGAFSSVRNNPPRPRLL